jgi:hypothetical protein
MRKRNNLPERDRRCIFVGAAFLELVVAVDTAMLADLAFEVEAVVDDMIYTLGGTSGVLGVQSRN